VEKEKKGVTNLNYCLRGRRKPYEQGRKRKKGKIGRCFDGVYWGGVEREGSDFDSISQKGKKRKSKSS